MIQVLAIITVKPGTRDSFIKEFKANVPNVLAEKGCIEYAPAIDAPIENKVQTKFGEETVVIIEKWESMEALKDHMVAPHMAAYAAKVKDMVTSRKIHILSPA